MTHAPSLAGVESLISEPRLTSHSKMTEDQRAKQGIPDGFVRLSCGVEDADDIIADLEQALGRRQARGDRRQARGDRREVLPVAIARRLSPRRLSPVASVALSPPRSPPYLPPVIRFAHVFKDYPKGAALKNISLHIAKGEFVFLTGHSGAGKSTVLKLLYAELRPTSGNIRVSGFSIGELAQDDVPRLRRRLGIVFQDFRLLEDRTAEENVAFALEVTGARPDMIAPKVMRVLTQVGLAAKAQAYPQELSGGEQQRVAIARALVNDPTILVADEPTGNLDERATRGVFQLIRDINAGGTAVVMATHDLDLVKQTTYRTVELREGSIVFDSGVDDGAAAEGEEDE